LSKVIRRLKFATKTNGIVIGNLPTRPIEKGLFGERFLTRVTVDKYCDHIPLYRTQQRLSREGIQIPYSTLSDIPRQICQLADLLEKDLRKQVLSSHYLQVDETPHPVMDSKVKGKTHRGFLWVYRSVEKTTGTF